MLKFFKILQIGKIAKIYLFKNHMLLNMLNQNEKAKNRANKTRLYVLESGTWVAGNASALIELVTTGTRTIFSSVSARNAAVDITHAAEDFACADYKCFALDTVATACDVTSSVAAFVPGNVSRTVFGVASSTSCFCRTLRNKCKESNVFGCN